MFPSLRAHVAETFSVSEKLEMFLNFLETFCFRNKWCLRAKQGNIFEKLSSTPRFAWAFAGSVRLREVSIYGKLKNFMYHSEYRV